MRRLLVLLCFCASTALALPAAAQPQGAEPPPPGLKVATDDRAGTSRAEGDRLFEQGRYEEAYAAFAAAWAIEKSARIGLGLARCEAKLGRFRDAAEHLSLVVNMLAPGSTERGLAGRELQEVTSKVGTIEVSVNRSDADILIDGRVVATSSRVGPVFVEPGRHHVEARKGGYATVEKTLDVPAGSEQKVALGLSPPSAASKEPTLAIGIAGTAVAVVGLGVEIGLFAAARAKHNEADQERAALQAIGPCPSASTARCADLRSTLATGARLENGAVGATVGTLSVCVGTAAYLLLQGRSGSSRRGGGPLRVAPGIGPKGGGFVIDGAF